MNTCYFNGHFSAKPGLRGFLADSQTLYYPVLRHMIRCLFLSYFLYFVIQLIYPIVRRCA